jgi:hypothetical protein
VKKQTAGATAEALAAAAFIGEIFKLPAPYRVISAFSPLTAFSTLSASTSSPDARQCCNRGRKVSSSKILFALHKFNNRTIFG